MSQTPTAITLDTTWITGEVQIVNMHRIGPGETPGTVDLIPDFLHERVPTPTGRVMHLTPKQARDIAAALAYQADVAEAAQQDAEVRELADVLARFGHPGCCNDREADARAIIAAGYRKARTA